MRKYDDFLDSIIKLDYEHAIEKYVEYYKEILSEKVNSYYVFLENKIMHSMGNTIPFKTLRKNLGDSMDRNIRNWDTKEPKRDTIIEFIFKLMEYYNSNLDLFERDNVNFLDLCNDLLTKAGYSSLYFRNLEDIIIGYCLYQKIPFNECEEYKKLFKKSIDSSHCVQIPVKEESAELWLSDIKKYFEKIEIAREQGSVVYTTNFFNNEQLTIINEEKLVEHCNKYVEMFSVQRNKTIKNLVNLLYAGLVNDIKRDDTRLSINEIDKQFTVFYGFGRDGFETDEIIGYITQPIEEINIEESKKKRDSNKNLTMLADILKGSKKDITRLDYILWLMLCYSFLDEPELFDAPICVIDEALMESDFFPISGNEDKDLLSNLISFALVLDGDFDKDINEILYDLYAAFVKNNLYYPLWR